MTENRHPGSPQVSQSWDTYWHGSRDSDAYSAGGTSHPTVLAFWEDVFAAARDDYDDLKVVDVASGSGAIVQGAMRVFSDELPDFTCVDISDSAIKALCRRFSKVQGIVADAREIPLSSESYDLATSQFGIEYAGLDAVAEMTRLVAPQGTLALLLHHRRGGIYRQCSASLAAIRQMASARFIPLAVDMFSAGFAVIQGGDKRKYEKAVKEFVPAIRSMESIMRQFGQQVADGTILRLYQDVRTIHERLQNYDPGEVLDWLSGMQREVDAFAGRMQSMCDAAIDKKAFSALCRSVENQDFEITRREPLQVPDRDEVLAWALVARRR